jgi:8-amino-7-oxononanoate synthase
MTDKGFLTAQTRQSLVAGVRKTRSSDATRVPGPVKRDVSFQTLPAYRAMKSQADAAQLMGISNPFHRVHSVRAGATSRVNQRDILNFASYDYLDLNRSPEITEAVARAARDWGTSVSASRLTAGERPFHEAFEAALAATYGTDAALAFVSGHATNVSVISSLVGPKDIVIHDAFAHNSIVMGAQASGALRRLFAHNDLDKLEETLAGLRDSHERALIVTEGLFSMDGDAPDLARLVEIKERWGAWLMVDEAHSLGVLGATGRGIFEEQGVDPRHVDIWMGTLSKTLCSCGGYIAGSQALIDYLRFHAPGMVYSVGLPATATVAAHTALDLMHREPDRVARLRQVSEHFEMRARERGLDLATGGGYAVVPVIVGDSLRTVFLADRLFQRGINAFPIIPPGVPDRTARLRFFLSAAHTPDEIDRAVDATADELERLVADDVSVATMVRMIEGRAS